MRKLFGFYMCGAGSAPNMPEAQALLKKDSVTLRVFALAAPRSELEAQARKTVFITLRVIALAAPRSMLEAQALMKLAMDSGGCTRLVSRTLISQYIYIGIIP